MNVLENWIKEHSKDIKDLNLILIKIRKLHSSQLKASLEQNIIEWVLEHSKLIKVMKEIELEGEK